MARAIDADVVSKRFRRWLEGPHEATEYNAGFGDAIWHVLNVIEHMPTLTQPNEPLAMEQLRESPHGKIKDSTLESICNRANEIASRPPEGEEGN